MIGYPQALQQLLAVASPLGERDRAASASIGEVLAVPIQAPHSLPSFDAAAMDGYALPSGHFAAGNEWPIEATQYAGHGQARASAGAVWEITTGARMPDGLHSVIPVEQVQMLAAASSDDPRPRIRLLQPVTQGQHVRLAASDLHSGQALLQAGTRLRAEHLMLLHALGIEQVRVREAARCAVICTGGELVSSATQPLDSGQIRDSNRGYLRASLAEAGADCVHASTVDDDPGQWRQALAAASEAGAQLVISTGAVSMGALDFVPQALRDAGAEILFHKVAIRPGKPLLLARLRDGTLYLGLSGNPAACAVGMAFFVLPLLRAMQGLPALLPWRLPLQEDLETRPGLCHFLAATLQPGADGAPIVQVLKAQSSSRLLPLVQANAWVMLADGGSLRAGEPVAVFARDLRAESATLPALAAC